MSWLVLDCVLVADRGVAAVRVLRALQRLGIKAVGLHTEADASALHATLADESVLIGATTAAYGDQLKVLEAARQSGAQAVHPGLARTPGLQQAVAEAELEWLGEPLQVPVELRAEGDLVEARLSDEVATLPPVAPRAAEIVTGLDLTCAGLVESSAGLTGASGDAGASATGPARAGVGLSVDVLATTLAPVTRMELPAAADVWIDAAVEVGSMPVDPLLAVLTVWGRDTTSAYALARTTWEQLVIEGPVVRRPAALEGVSP